MLNYTDTKKKLSVHNIIGAEDYTKIKTLESKKTIPRPASSRANQTRPGSNFSKPRKYCNKYAVTKSDCLRLRKSL